jgi:hypothetical protein
MFPLNFERLPALLRLRHAEQAGRVWTRVSEAMNFAKPCVGCFDDGAEDVIIHGETGIVGPRSELREDLLGVRSLLTDRRDREMGRTDPRAAAREFYEPARAGSVKEHCQGPPC